MIIYNGRVQCAWKNWGGSGRGLFQSSELACRDWGKGKNFKNNRCMEPRFEPGPHIPDERNMAYVISVYQKWTRSCEGRSKIEVEEKIFGRIIKESVEKAKHRMALPKWHSVFVLRECGGKFIRKNKIFNLAFVHLKKERIRCSTTNTTVGGSENMNYFNTTESVICLHKNNKTRCAAVP